MYKKVIFLVGFILVFGLADNALAEIVTVGRVGVYYYPWYGPWANSVSRSLRYHLVPKQPAQLGEYNSFSSDVISEHIDMSHHANIHFWAVSWWGPSTYTDVAFKNSILAHNRAGELKYAIMYESTGRLGADYSNLLPDFDTTSPLITSTTRTT